MSKFDLYSYNDKSILLERNQEQDDINAMIKWLGEHTEGRYIMYEAFINFKLDSDALIFRIRYGL